MTCAAATSAYSLCLFITIMYALHVIPTFSFFPFAFWWSGLFSLRSVGSEACFCDRETPKEERYLRPYVTGRARPAQSLRRSEFPISLAGNGWLDRRAFFPKRRRRLRQPHGESDTQIFMPANIL